MAETVPTWEETVPESEALVSATTAPIEQTLRLLTLGSIASAEGNALRQEREARKAALRNAFEQEQLAQQEAEARRIRYSPRTREGFVPTEEELQGASKILGTELTQAGKDVRRSMEAGSLLAAGIYKPRGTWADVAKQLSVPRGATPEQLAEYPYQQGLQRLPESLQIAAEVPGGIAEVAPRIAGVAGLQAMGIPAPVAGGLMFGLTEEGFNPQEAAVGAAIPYVGKYGGELARALAKKLGVSNKAAQNLVAAIGHGGGATAYLGTITASEIAGMAPEDRLEAVKKALPGSIGMLLMTMPGMKAELERGTPQQLAKLLNSAQMRAGYRPRVPERRLGMRMQPMDQPFADPEVQALADQALRERVSGLAIPEEAAALPKLRRQLTRQVVPGREGRTLAERTREPGETLVRPTVAGLRVEPGFERTASDLLLERQKPEPMNDVERQILQGFVDEEAKAGGVIPQKVLPKGVSYRAPTEAPSPAEYQRRVERDNVEAGLTIREVEQEPEPVTPQGKQPEVTSIVTATGRTLTKPGVLSALQRSRLRNALANGASEEVLVNIMRMSDRDIARRNPPTTNEEFRAARRQTEKAAKGKAKTAPAKAEPQRMSDYDRYQAARLQLRDMRQRLGTAAFRSPEYMAIAGEMERIKNRNGGMPPTKPSPVVEGKAEPKSVPPTAPVGEAQAEPGAVAAAPVGQAISEPTVEAEVAQAPIAGAAPEYVSRTTVPQGITAAAAQVRRQALQEFPHIRGLVENGEIVFTDGKESWPENVKAAKGSKDFEAVYLTNTGQVVFDARMFTGENAGKLGEIIVHEVAIHKGLRVALGEEVFNRTTIDIWNNLSNEEKIAILKKTGTKLMPVSEQMQQIVGEEWLAYESQRVARTGVTTTVWTKIADGFRKALRAIGFKRSLSDTEIAMMISKGWEGLKAKEQAKSAEIPESAKENAVSVSNAETSPVAVNTLDGVATARFSLRTWEATDQKKLVEDLVTSGIADRRTATKWMRDISNVAAMIVRNREQLDYNASPEFASLKANADAYYTLSEDYSTICRKGAKLLATVAQIMVREGGITSEQMWKVRSLLRDKGEEVTCAACYVWSRKINIGPQLDRIAAKYPEIPHEILFDPQKSDILKRDYPKAWAMLMKAGSGIGKAFEVRSEYSREILSNKQITPDFVKRQNMFSGLRSQSWSDFEIQHLIDKMQSAADKALVGLMGHSYTKVPQYVELVAATGEMTNMSLIPLGKGLDASGRLVFDDVEGMPFAESMRLRNLHDKTAGTVIIGATDAHIIACMKDGRIDYIIPYHKSGLNVTLRKAGELAGWRDYEKEQKEGIADPAKFADYMAWKKSQGFNKAQSEVRPWEYWDKTADGNTNAQNYLAYCEKNGIIPKFQRFAGMDGYWKLLVDRRMYDNQNRYIEQQVIKPNFDMKVVGRLVDGYLRGEWKGRGDDTPDMDVVREVLKGKEMQRAQQAQIVSEFRKAEGPGEVIGAEPGFRAAKTLADAKKIFEEKPKAKEPLRPMGRVRTGILSEFHPLDELSQMVADSYPYTTTRATPTGTVTVSTPRKAKALAGIFEQLKGSRGKGEAEVYRFDRDVGKLVKGNELNFNVYMFANRTLDRLYQDARQGISRRKVGDWTMADAQTVLRELESEVGFDTFDKFRQAAAKYQDYMDRALLLQVESGRMSKNQYNVIKSQNLFYAPFKVMKHIELQDQPQGTGKKVDTMADYTKAMEGVEDPDLRLGDMMAAAKQALLVSRTLADKAVAMKNIADLAVLDTRGLFVRKMFKGQNPREGFEAVNVYENGKVYKYEVPKFVAQAIQVLGPASNGVYVKWLGRLSVPFKAGATAFNVPFQVSNLVADVPRAALVSKYGIRAVSDSYMYPLDFVESLLSSMGANVLGIRNKTYYDFLESGAAGSSVQEFLTSKALLGKKSLGKQISANTLGKLGDFAQAIEQVSKVMGVKRAIRFEKVKSGAELAKLVPEAITEIRRFSGSPDFGRQGSWVQQARLNLLYMFLNARIQGAAADVGRLMGADGSKTAAITWARLIGAVGIPTVLLYLLNNSSDDLRDGYKQRSDYEKRNYWLIPKDTFITTEDGERIRDYWRIPKRESSKWVANLTESALEFAEKKDPEEFKGFAVSMLEDISPVNIQGDTFQERLESVGASMNPIIKAPLEMATGRDMYRHQNLIPEIMRGAKTPELQFKDRTPELFKWGAERMPDIMPSVLRSPIMLENITRNLTAGLLTQWLPRKPIEGRTSWENSSLLQRFQAMPYIDTDKQQKLVDELKGEAVDSYLIRHRKAQKYIEDNKGADLDVVMGKAYESGDLQDVKLANHLVDLYIAKQNGVNAVERRLIALPAEQRAKFVLQALSEKTGEEKSKLWEDWVRKRVLTEATLMEMMKQDPEAKYAPIGPGIPKEAAPLNVPSYEETVPVNR